LTAGRRLLFVRRNEATTNPVDWTAVATNPVLDVFVDEQSTNYLSRFYRLLIH
jgi:hypothetical protein